MIIFIWKVSMGLVKGYDMKFQHNARRGWLAVPHPVSQTTHVTVRRARTDSLSHRGALLFNLCPIGLRNLASDHQDMFKGNLDAWLSEIPDEPTVPGLQRAAKTNSLLHQLPLAIQS